MANTKTDKIEGKCKNCLNPITVEIVWDKLQLQRSPILGMIVDCKCGTSNSIGTI